jgi:uncharacterized coiled-coil DUF342 family protein
MNALTGMEKFSHLEDKIYLTLEFVKKLREDKERLEKEVANLRNETISLNAERLEAEEKLAELRSERDSILLKVEGMLDAIASIDPEVAAAAGGNSNG